MKTLSVLTTFPLVLLIVLCEPVSAQSLEMRLGEVDDQLNAARQVHLDLIAPRSFGRAEARFRDAQQRHEQGRSISEIQRLLQEAEQHLAEAATHEEVGRVLLKDALQARSAALDVNVPDLAADLWKEAESHLQSAGRSIEEGNTRSARDRAARATDTYRAAELKAVRTDVLDLARRLRSEALDKDADRWASVTFREAESLLRQAEGVLQSDPVQQQPNAREYAASAATQYQRAARIADLAKTVHRDTRTQVEGLVLEQEAQIRRITDTLHFQPDFVSGIGPVVDQIVLAINSFYRNNRILQQDVAERDEQIRQLNTRIDSLQAWMTSAEEREQFAMARLRAREQREQALNRARTIFSPNEADVLIGPDELTVRLYSLNFPVGSAEIRPENFLLLANLQRVLRMFPDASVVITGHTDAQGDDASNLALSEERAQAVREYLLANMELNPARVQAVGQGESQPIASNDTQEGRAKNRRIDVMLDLPEP